MVCMAITGSLSLSGSLSALKGELGDEGEGLNQGTDETLPECKGKPGFAIKE